ncbi:hypothetical protein BH23PLA1_BH23PLA1_22440 [soil metagenome]
MNRTNERSPVPNLAGEGLASDGTGKIGAALEQALLYGAVMVADNRAELPEDDRSLSGTVARRSEPGGGWTVLDGAALVIGAAVAAVHLRQAVPDGLAGPGWALMWLSFSGVATTAAGPPVYLFRHLRRRPSSQIRLGDRLWALLGTPWLLAALVRAALPEGPVEVGRSDLMDLYTFGLAIGIGVASILSLGIVWAGWVMVPPGQVPGPEESSPWTHKVGLTLAVAWPLQIGFGLVVLGTPS